MARGTTLVYELYSYALTDKGVIPESIHQVKFILLSSLKYSQLHILSLLRLLNKTTKLNHHTSNVFSFSYLFFDFLIFLLLGLPLPQ